MADINTISQYQVYDPLMQQRRLDLDMSRYDPAIGGLSDAYMQRLMARDQMVRKHLNTPYTSGAEAVQRRLVMDDPSDIIRQETNFSANPYDWFDPQARLLSGVARTKLPKRAENRMDPMSEADVMHSNPYNIYINPTARASTPSSLLGHESGHTGQIALYNRIMMADAAKKPQNLANVWYPLFSEDFLRRLTKERENPVSPYQWKSGFGTDPYETMSYLMGREAELPKGQTLMDDPSTSKLFKDYPGMYDEYTRSRDRIKDSWRKRNNPKVAP